MFIWSLQISIFSIILIFLVHHLITFFKSTLTVPKIKDLVNAPAQKYETMWNVMGSNTLKNDSYKESLLPKKERKESIDIDVDSMKNELKSFLKNKMNSFQSTEIAALGSASEPQYSEY